MLPTASPTSAESILLVLGGRVHNLVHDDLLESRLRVGALRSGRGGHDAQVREIPTIFDVMRCEIINAALMDCVVIWTSCLEGKSSSFAQEDCRYCRCSTSSVRNNCRSKRLATLAAPRLAAARRRPAPRRRLPRRRPLRHHRLDPRPSRPSSCSSS